MVADRSSLSQSSSYNLTLLSLIAIHHRGGARYPSQKRDYLFRYCQMRRIMDQPAHPSILLQEILGKNMKPQRNYVRAAVSAQ
jgi:hypothetical protein